jgi:hypothetical protein
MFDPVQEHNLDHALRHDEWPVGRFLAHHLQGCLPNTITPLDLLFLVGLACTPLGLKRLWDTHAGAKLLCEAFELMLNTADTRQKKRLLSWGDTTHPASTSAISSNHPSLPTPCRAAPMNWRSDCSRKRS